MKYILRLLIGFAFLSSSLMMQARDYIIYSIHQSLPMGGPNEVIKKNFYVNMGTQQGITDGSVLNVYRTLSRIDPYETKKRYSYKVKVGEVEVIHAEEQIAIAKLKTLDTDAAAPLFDIEGLMIGDRVSVSVD